jgi:serine/threonine protein kinase
MILEPEWDDVSEDAKDLVRKLLTYDPVKRISAGDAV